jgi:hypothetical protein
MLSIARKSRASRVATGHAAEVRDGRVYDGHGASLYRQALLTLGDADLAEQVVLEVIVGECTRPDADDRDAGEATRRMAVAVFRRCQGLATGLTRQDHLGGLSVTERGGANGGER